MISGESTIGIPRNIEWAVRYTTHGEGDPQYDKHIDNAVGPIFKAWVSITSPAQFPLHEL